MKTIATASAFCALLAISPALGADLPEPADQGQTGYSDSYRKDVWQGAYAGASLGYEIVTADLGPVDLSLDGAFGNLRVGYDWTLDRFVFGVCGEVTWNDIGVGDFDIDNDFSWAPCARAGVVLGNTLIYGLGKYSFRDVSGTSDIEALGLGLGAEVHFGGRLFGNLEYVHSFDDDISPGVDVSSDAVSVGLSFKVDPFQ